MKSPTTKELRKLLSEYLDGSLHAGEFSDRFASLSSLAHHSNDEVAQRLCYAVGWVFLDRRRGLSSREQMVQCLSLLAAEPANTVVLGDPVMLGAVSSSVAASGTSTTLQAAAETVVQRVGVGRALVYESAGQHLG